LLIDRAVIDRDMKRECTGKDLVLRHLAACSNILESFKGGSKIHLKCLQIQVVAKGHVGCFSLQGRGLPDTYRAGRLGQKEMDAFFLVSLKVKNNF